MVNCGSAIISTAFPSVVAHQHLVMTISLVLPATGLCGVTCIWGLTHL